MDSIICTGTNWAASSAEDNAAGKEEDVEEEDRGRWFPSVAPNDDVVTPNDDDDANDADDAADADNDNDNDDDDERGGDRLLFGESLSTPAKDVFPNLGLSGSIWITNLLRMSSTLLLLRRFMRDLFWDRVGVVLDRINRSLLVASGLPWRRVSSRLDTSLPVDAPLPGGRISEFPLWVVAVAAAPVSTPFSVGERAAAPSPAPTPAPGSKSRSAVFASCTLIMSRLLTRVRSRSGDP